MAQTHRITRALAAALLIMTFNSCSHGTTSARGPAHSTLDPSDDPNLWLEDIEGQKSLDWVRAHNDPTLKGLKGDKRFAEVEREVRRIVLAKDRIPMVSYRGGWLYNFWQDEKNVRGLWRRTGLAEYRKAQPKWEVLLDLDALAKQENENWVYKGVSCLPPANERCLLSLSRGGKDAVVVREFDVAKREFVPGGFTLPEAKSSVSWMDADTLLVGTDFGPGSLTTSGYPRIVKLWKRGTPLAQATQVFEGKETDVSAGGYVVFRPEGNLTVLTRAPSFFEEENFVWAGPGQGGSSEPKKMPVPSDASFQGAFKGKLYFQLRSDWVENGVTYARGSLVSMPADDLDPAKLEKVYVPSERVSLEGVMMTRDSLLALVLDHVQGKVLELGSHGAKAIPFPANGSVDGISSDAYENLAIFQFSSFLAPQTLYSVDAAHPGVPPHALKRAPERFSAKGLESEQLWAKSKDGTEIPYFVIRKKRLKLDGSNPTLLYGYGGFEVSMKPAYSGPMGKAWLEKGGVYVLANIRGGGEFGPAWHQAALKENRQKAFDDFAAVAEDLIHRKITSPRHLGVMGGSNGGLLMGATFTQRPELFNAVVCQVPLLDMIRYTKLLAGASWMGEYGDPDVAAEREAILKYSPYHNVFDDQKYPKVFFVTSTKDDRVHPAHARKMAARMEAQGHPFLYFENIEGGHGAAANLEQEILRRSLEYTYLYQQLF